MDVINLRAFAHNYLFNQGNFSFDGSRTGAQLASGGLADFLLGYTSTGSGFAQDAPIPSLQHQNIFALYAQDAWKVTHKLTATAGLRLDPLFGHTDPKGHVVSISLQDLAANIHSKAFPTAPAGYLFTETLVVRAAISSRRTLWTNGARASVSSGPQRRRQDGHPGWFWHLL